MTTDTQILVAYYKYFTEALETLKNGNIILDQNHDHAPLNDAESAEKCTFDAGI